MADTTFVPKSQPPVTAAWLQDLNDLFYRGTKPLTVTSLTTALVTTGAGPLVLQTTDASEVQLKTNGTLRFAVSSGAPTLYPNGTDAVADIGTPANRIRALYSTIIDSGTTGTVLIRVNNGEAIADFVRPSGVASVNRWSFQGGASGSNGVSMFPTGGDTDIIPVITSRGNAGINFQTNVATPEMQFQILRTASATRNLTVTGSNGSDPTLSTTAGNINFGVSIKGASGTVALVGATSGSGTGIAFPATQSASTDVNTLDDYEEGSWTPSLGGNTTYFQQTGQYVKIGKAVYVIGLLNINAIGTGSTSQVSGLPFTVTSTNGMSPGASIDETSGLATSVVSMVGRFDASATTVRIMSRTAAATGESINAIFASGCTLTLAGFYFV